MSEGPWGAGRSLRQENSLHGGANVIRLMRPLQQRRRSPAKRSSSRTSHDGSNSVSKEAKRSTPDRTAAEEHGPWIPEKTSRKKRGWKIQIGLPWCLSSQLELALGGVDDESLLPFLALPFLSPLALEGSSRRDEVAAGWECRCGWSSCRRGRRPVSVP